MNGVLAPASITFQPTGPNIYLRGSGYVALKPLNPSDYNIVPPGYTWYWESEFLCVPFSAI
jgi:hypothetical protein